MEALSGVTIVEVHGHLFSFVQRLRTGYELLGETKSVVKE